MKKLLFLFAIFCFLLASGCGNAPKDKESHDGDVTEESDDIKKSDDKITDCDDFLDRYEEWMDEYMTLLEKYMENPLDADMATKFMELSGEALNWATEWGAMMDCASDEEYEKRFDEIEKKAEEKLEEMGLG